MINGVYTLHNVQFARVEEEKEANVVLEDRFVFFKSILIQYSLLHMYSMLSYWSMQSFLLSILAIKRSFQDSTLIDGGQNPQS